MIALASLVGAFLLALSTMSLLGVGCGENRDTCNATSSPVVAVYLSWLGFVGVLGAVVLSRARRRRARAVAIAATIVVYVAWLAALFGR